MLCFKLEKHCGAPGSLSEGAVAARRLRESPPAQTETLYYCWPITEKCPLVGQSLRSMNAGAGRTPSVTAPPCHLKVNCPAGAREAGLGHPQGGRLWSLRNEKSVCCNQKRTEASKLPCAFCVRISLAVRPPESPAAPRPEYPGLWRRRTGSEPPTPGPCLRLD